MLNFLNPPELAAIVLALSVEVLGDLFHPLARAILAEHVEREDLAHDLGFRLVNRQFLFEAAMSASLSCLYGFEAEGRLRAIVIALTGVFLHAAQSMFRILLALILIEHHHHMTEHLTGGIVIGLLSDGDEFDAKLQNLAFVHERLSQIAEETGKTVNDDSLKRRRLLFGFEHHLLKDRPFIIRRRCARFDKFFCDDVPITFRPLTHLAQLVGNRQIVLSLTAGRNTGVNGYKH